MQSILHVLLMQQRLARVPGTGTAGDMHLEVGLSVLDDEAAPVRFALDAMTQRLDRARLVRALVDIVPNPWLVWDWVNTVVERLAFADERIAHA